MDHLIRKILEVELFACRPDVSFLEPIPLADSIRRSQANIRADIELPFIIKEGHNVLLQDVSTRSPHIVNLLVLDEGCDLLQRFSYCNACAAVSVLSGLHKPHISSFYTWLDCTLLRLFELVVNLLLLLIVVLQKLWELFAVQIFDVKCNWNIIPRINLLCLIVTLNIKEQRFLIT